MQPAHWLFLRGLGREQRHWGTLPDLFAQRTGSRVHCLDLPGTGTEHARTSPGTIPAFVADLRPRWEKLARGLEGPWGILAMSLGGMVAMQWAWEFPADFARVVLVNSSAGDLSPPWQRMGLGVLPMIVRAAFTVSDPVERERLALRATTRGSHDVDAIARTWASFHHDRPVTRNTFVKQLVAATRFRSPPRLAPPVLVLAGSHDALAHPRCARALAAHFGAPLKVSEGSGHDLSLDAPSWLAEQVNDWANAP